MRKQDSELLSILQTMQENDLLRQILVPLFRSFGYPIVDFHGGPDEQGKDIICWKRDTLDEIELAVVQTKRYKPSRCASDKQSFGEVVTQLCQCLETPVPNTDGNEYRPSAVYFVTPYELETRTLGMRFSKVAALKQFNVKVIEGRKLVELVLKQLPQIAVQLLGPSHEIVRSVSPQLTNEILMNALGFPAKRHIRDFYTDIDIAVVHVYAKYYLCSTFSPQTKTVELTSHEWSDLKPILSRIKKVFGVDVVTQKADIIENLFAQREGEWSLWKEESRRLNGIIDGVAIELSELREKTITIADRISLQEPALGKKLRESTIKALQTIDAFDGDVNQLDIHLIQVVPNEEIDNLLYNYVESRTTFLQSTKKARNYAEMEPAKVVPIVVNGQDLVRPLMDRRNQLRDDTARLNTSKPTGKELRTFIEDCHKLFKQTYAMLINPVIALATGLVPSEEPISTFTRLSSPIDRVFDTGLNIAVLGEAGAGKTTALQMYAFACNESDGPKKLALYAPLPHIVRLAEGKIGEDREIRIRLLESGIVSYLQSLGAAYTLSDFHQFASTGGVLLLDSIDEAYATSPWVIDALVELAEQYQKLQFITSSRVSGDYANRIPYIGITLMPFTDEQLERFVARWFGASGSPPGEAIRLHLSNFPEIAEVVRNPLLATAMCSLQEYNVPLPTNEIRLYQDWLNLLVGTYDIHKKVSRIISARHHLVQLAERIAFFLHSRGLRDSSKTTLENLAVSLFDQVMGPKQAAEVLAELIHPCNILMPTVWKDRLGFLHLRYQEYLAACELRNNRALRLTRYLSSSWWKGVLVLFSQMQESLDWIVDEIADKPITPIMQDNLVAMIASGPRKGRDELVEFVTTKARLDEKIESYLQFLQ